MNKILQYVAAVAVCVASVTGSARAAATPGDVRGYLRTGTGGTASGGTEYCFSLPGMDYKFRLGNECETYMELELNHSLIKLDDGSEFVFDTMASVFRPYTASLSDLSAKGALGLPQAWVEARHLPWLDGASLWVGSRYYYRHDLHPIDFFYWNPSGVGIGVDEVKLPFGKFAAAIFETVDTGGPDPQRRTTYRPDFRLIGVPANADATFEFGVELGYVSDHFDLRAPGREKLSPWVTVQHDQKKLLGGENTLAAQFATGSLAAMGGDAGSVNPAGTIGSKQWRLVEMFLLNAGAKWSSAFTFVYQNKDRVGENLGNAPQTSGDSSTSFGMGVRPAYHVNKTFKLQADFGYEAYTPKQSAANPSTQTRSVFKASIAPTIVAGESFFSRPELRGFLTYAASNAAAQSSGIVGQGSCSITNTSDSVFGCDTYGITFGVQAETWF